MNINPINMYYDMHGLGEYQMENLEGLELDNCSMTVTFSMGRKEAWRLMDDVLISEGCGIEGYYQFQSLYFFNTGIDAELNVVPPLALTRGSKEYDRYIKDCLKKYKLYLDASKIADLEDIYHLLPDDTEVRVTLTYTLTMWARFLKQYNSLNNDSFDYQIMMHSLLGQFIKKYLDVFSYIRYYD